ncbi:hypothetical protein DM02DRAFT_617487 [Periconia macrospinosa]|uniref:Uncharacterized protein n=1 Tax=Periconia macrospinosa TaxID=97972 RepID=A0A2V1DEL2_9PLEO|nr:hypothetical protein DM02DRAFT_617487 [Periconia macrospinosa]
MAKPPQSVPMPADPHNLDNLQAMINLVLVSGGNYLKHYQLGQNSSQSLQLFKRTVAGAADRFHDSLDELEAEVLHAQLVLRRDLALMKADRRKREAAAKEKEAEKARLAAESTAQKPVPPPVKQEEPPKPASPPPVKTETPVKSNTPPEPPPEPSITVHKTENTSPLPAPGISAAPGDAQNAPVEDATADLGQDNNEFDFDALFGDTMDTTGGEGDNQGDLNLDGSGNDLNFSLDDTGPSLLPGLEDYAKSGGDDLAHDTNTNINLDLPMPDLDMTSTAPTQPSTTKPAEEPPAQQTALDDLNLEAMTTDNLDDLFDMEYTNPEESQFDDAFFGFGE